MKFTHDIFKENNHQLPMRSFETLLNSKFTHTVKTIYVFKKINDEIKYFF